ncbi:ribonuclease domain-containing protein [Streptomyces sp. NPDC056269]|uniref:ribonuclease domain-containing protein n=1 Tax=Streptomyces sp. NPDC056269 TaxID=3345768 RepID=UPI0035DBA7CD
MGCPAFGREPAGDGVTFSEYDVNPYVKGVNRGGERLVVGTDGSAYYTADHYFNWSKIR